MARERSGTELSLQQAPTDEGMEQSTFFQAILDGQGEHLKLLLHRPSMEVPRSSQWRSTWQLSSLSFEASEAQSAVWAPGHSVSCLNQARTSRVRALGFSLGCLMRAMTRCHCPSAEL